MLEKRSYLTLQCRWLNHSTSKVQSELHFTAYYNALAKELIPFLKGALKNNRKCSSTPDDIFQELMLYQARMIKEGREMAYKQLKNRAPLLVCPTDNVFFAHGVATWEGKLSNWADEAKSFCACLWPDSKPPESEIRAFAINQVLNPLLSEAENLIRQHSGTESFGSDDNPEQDKSKSDDLAAEMKALLDLAFKVRIPMKALFYWKAEKLIRDCYKNKGSLPLNFSTTFSGNEPEDEDQNSGGFEWDEEQHSEFQSLSTGNGKVLYAENEDNVEELKGIMDNEDGDALKERNFRKVEALLYAEVKAAEMALQSSRSASAYKQAEGRLEKEQKKFFRRLAVCSRLLLGDTEAEIIRELEITRDKVRTDVDNVFEILHEGFKAEFGDFRREQRLQAVLPTLKKIAANYKAPLANGQPESEKQPPLVNEFKRLLELTVKKADSALSTAETQKRQLEDHWLRCCFKKQSQKLLTPEQERDLRQDYLQWVVADGLSHLELALRLNLKPDEVAKHQQKIQRALQEIQCAEETLRLTQTEHQQESPKILMVLKLLLSDSCPLEDIARILGLTVAETHQHRELIQNLILA